MLRKFFLLSLFFCINSSAYAAFIDLGNSTVDTDTSLEWLDFSQSSGYSYNDIVSGSVSALSGWTHASTSYVQTLFANLGFAVEEQFYVPANSGPLAAFNLGIDLLGASSSASSFLSLQGIVNDGPDDLFRYRLGAQSGSRTDRDTGELITFMNVDLLTNGGSSQVGIGVDNTQATHFLVRQYIDPATVPETNVLWLLVPGLLGLMAASRRKL